MTFEALLAAAVATYVLLNFVVLPRITEAWKASRTLSKIAKAGLLGGLQLARDTALIASAVYVLFALLTLVLHFSFGGNAGVLAFVVASAERAHDAVKAVSGVARSYFFLVPAALIVYLAWRRQRDEFTRRFERLVDDEHDRLNREREQGAAWTDLAPDELMRPLDAQIAALEAALGALSADQHEQRQRLRREVITLREHRSETDYERRVRLDSVHALAEPSSTTPAWRRFIVSKGFFSDLKGLTRLLSRATLALLCVALMGVAGTAGVVTDLWARVVTLDDLRVEATTAEVAREWKEPPSSPAESLTEDDRTAIAHFTDSFARALSQNRNWRPLRSTDRPSRPVEQRLARRAVLDQVRLPTESERTGPAFVDDLPAADRELLDELAGSKLRESRLGRLLAEREGPRIKSFFGSTWDGVKAAVRAHAKTYHEPVTMASLESSLVDHIASAAFDTLVPQVEDSEIVKQARSAMSTATKKAVDEAVTTAFHRVMEDLAAGQPYAERIAKVKTENIPVSRSRAEALAALVHDRHLPDMAEIDRRVASSSATWQPPEGPGPPPTDRHPGAGGGGGGRTATGESHTVVHDVARRATGDGRYSLREESIDALAQYEDHFPRSVASQARTPLGQTLERFRLPADAPRFDRVAELKVSRAVSFAALRGFSRVGGVLIGTDPESPKSRIDTRTLTWRIDGRRVTITLGDGAGHAHDFGPYDRSLVHQALGYAADGRPVAVTMTKARPLQQLKIHLHPALVDTPLGCWVTHLDRLVDTYAGVQLPAREELTRGFREQFAVYNLAWALRFRTLGAVAGTQRASIEREAQEIIDATLDDARRGLTQPGLFGAASVFRRKPEFFDPSVVKVAASCQQNDARFESCAREKFASARALRRADVDVLNHWQEGYATFEPWSGVRERTYRVTSDLGFLRAPSDTSLEARLWPFDFIVQIAFTSAPVNLPAKEQERYVDERPIDFVDIHPRIAELVAAGIDRDGLRSAFEDLRAFTVLQRLFRTALHGHLGNDFPLEQLSRLTAATAGEIPYVHTSRWNGSYTAQTRIRLRDAAQAPVTAPWMRSAAAAAKRCDLGIERALASQTEFVRECDFSAFAAPAERACGVGSGDRTACLWTDMARRIVVLPQMVRLEETFGVLDDQRATRSPTCPPLAPVR
jgi:hypothetical protein